LAIVFLHTITDACTPVCLLTAITSVEAVTPPYGVNGQLHSSSHWPEVNRQDLDAETGHWDAIGLAD